MDILKFRVRGQALTLLNPNVNLIPVTDTVNQYLCQFEFSEDWVDLNKVVVFKNASYNVTKEVYLSTSNECYIPWEVLSNSGTIFLEVIGTEVRGDAVTVRIPSTLLGLKWRIQEGLLDVSANVSPTPDLFEQFVSYVREYSTSAIAARDEALIAKDAVVQSVASASAAELAASSYAESAENSASAASSSASSASEAALSVAGVVDDARSYVEIASAKAADAATEAELATVAKEDAVTAKEGAEAARDATLSAKETFDNNAETKLNVYNQNASEKTASYNANATEKLNAYNSNAESKVTEYNTNAEAKLDEYNTNANNRVAEFDSHTEQIQSQIDSKADKTDLAITNSYLDALYKLNKGQTYDVLEQESEAYSVDVPSGAKYVGIDKVGGKSVAWNQLVKNGNFADTSNWEINAPSSTSFSASGNIGKVTITSNTAGRPNISQGSTKPIVGHKYLLTCGVKITTSNIPNPYFSFLFGDMFNCGRISDTSWHDYEKIVSVTSNDYEGFFLYTSAPVDNYSINDTVEYRNVMAIDLTQMFGSTIADYIYSLEQATAGAGVAWFKKLFPADYYPYFEPTIISSQTDRVDVRGANIWNEEWEAGYWKNNGIKADSASTIRCKYHIPVEPNTTYYVSYPLQRGIRIFEMDISKNVIRDVGYQANSGFTTTSSARYIVLYTNSMDNIISYANNISIIKGTSGAYSPYSLQQIETNFPVLNSAGSVYDYIDLNEGKLHQRVGKYTFTGNETWARYDGKNVYLCNIIPNVKKVPNNNTIPNIIADKIEVKTFNTFYNDTDGVNTGFSISYLGVACIGKGTYDNISTLTGSTIHYELAKEIITDIEIPTELSDWLTVEAGGSITFHNTDEGKRLLIPNKLSFIRKLGAVSADEVSTMINESLGVIENGSY